MNVYILDHIFKDLLKLIICFYFKSLLSTSIVLSLLGVICAAATVGDLDAQQTRELKQEEKPYEYEEYPGVESKDGGYNNYESYVSYLFMMICK